MDRTNLNCYYIKKNSNTKKSKIINFLIHFLGYFYDIMKVKIKKGSKKDFLLYEIDSFLSFLLKRKLQFFKEKKSIIIDLDSLQGYINLNPKEVSLIKIDVEGAEYDVLLEMSRFLDLLNLNFLKHKNFILIDSNNLNYLFIKNVKC